VSRQNIFKVLFLSLVLSSCGLIEKWKTPEQPTDSKAAATSSNDGAKEADDLFAKSMNENKEAPLEAKSDAPSNITTNESPEVKDDLKSLEDEFSGNTSATTAKEVAQAPAQAPVPETKEVKVEEALPEIKQETAPAISENMNADAGKVMTYKVQKGETLMQIAFKIYGDIGKWKELKQMNGSKLSKNSALRANMQLKYNAPEKVFVWNPEGTPYMIKNGETLGTISNSVYQTPKKWKKLWENNKPLIKNPNVIYAGFTLYYKNDGMANYVQPKAVQRKVAAKNIAAEKSDQTNAVQANIEEVKVEQAISKLNENDGSEIDLTKEVQSAPVRDIKEEIKADEQTDEALIK
jgi:nucleoid-associated protein YgaU